MVWHGRSHEWLRYGGHNEVGIDLVIQKIRSLVPVAKA